MGKAFWSSHLGPEGEAQTDSISRHFWLNPYESILVIIILVRSL